MYNEPQYQDIIKEMKQELLTLRQEVGDTDTDTPRMKEIMDQYYW